MPVEDFDIKIIKKKKIHQRCVVAATFFVLPVFQNSCAWVLGSTILVSEPVVPVVHRASASKPCCCLESLGERERKTVCSGEDQRNSITSDDG